MAVLTRFVLRASLVLPVIEPTEQHNLIAAFICDVVHSDRVFVDPLNLKSGFRVYVNIFRHIISGFFGNINLDLVYQVTITNPPITF